MDAFYSWDAARLQQVLGGAQAQVSDAERANVLYYQAWAEAGNYQIQLRKPCVRAADGRVSCAIRVTDDLGAAMGYVATDTFWLKLAALAPDETLRSGTGTSTAGQIVGVEFTADDPPVLQEVVGWLSKNRPEVFSGPCEKMFAGGTTPALCVRAIVQGAQDYMAIKSR